MKIENYEDISQSALDDITYFIYNGEIYYRMNATNQEIDGGLQSLVEESMHDYDCNEKIMLQAQACLIIRQKELILKNHCA